MRVGPDSGRRWWVPTPPGLEPGQAGGCITNAWGAARRRHWMHRARWLNDPDSVHLGAGLAGDAWVDWVADRGLPLVLGDAVRELDRDAVRRWESAVERQHAAR